MLFMLLYTEHTNSCGIPGLVPSGVDRTHIARGILCIHVGYTLSISTVN